MFRLSNLGIVDLIGVTLIVVALISAGGIVITTDTYVNINDTWANCQAFIPNVNITSSNDSNEVTLTTSLFINNPSKLDIEIISSNVEYNVYVFNAEPDFSQLGYDGLLDHFISPGRGIAGANGTVYGDSQKNLYLSLFFRETPLYWDRFQDASVNGSTFVFISGFALYEIIDYPYQTEKLWFAYANWVTIYEQ
jgi:hypothetical protein